ncbi:protein AFG1 isoform X3 [Magnolia sinica]|uniref:protein AFG1 isoform X3 n=1 Tax=Magnolia sinica TaxID=86752 RepID=UPI00265B28AE|nr:protein AFG1 isoform X3 [Magnolia sinica]
MRRFCSSYPSLRRFSRTSFFSQGTLINRCWNFQRDRFRLSSNLSQLAAGRHPGPLSRYRSLVEQGKLQHDLYQERVASELEDLLGRLEQYEKDMEEYHASLANWEKNRETERRRLLMEEAEVKQQGGIRKSVNKHRNGFVEKWILRRRNENIEPGVGRMVSYLNREKKLDSIVGTHPVAPRAPKGLYLYGSVGSGKTMLMDMFYSATDGIVKHRRRFHFHEAMLEINEHMHKIWKKQVEEKTFQSVISSWIENLPFDTKVKEWLAAEEKYKQEVQMKHILPAVADRFLVDRQADQGGASILCFDEIQVHYFWPLDNQARNEFEKMWHEAVNQSGGSIISDTIPVMFGRMLEVHESCNGVARFTFDYLCGRPLGAADYIAVAKNYHTVFISDIPMMSMRIRDKARRFITLIDELYNHHCCLFCTAASSIDDLFQGTDEGTLFDLESFQFETEIEGGKLRRDVLAEGDVGSGGAPSGIASLLSGQEEMFAFRRAVSRLIEMQTPLYLEVVQHIHPYFQGRRQELPSNHFSIPQLQLS